MLVVVRLVALVVALCVAAACEAGTKDKASDPSVTILRPLETAASTATQFKIRAYFKRAALIEFRFVPFDEVEVRGYKANVDSMRYSYLYRCGDHCPLIAGKLMTRLMTARRAAGNCPWITAAVLFRDKAKVEFGRVLVDSTGHCLEADGQTYILTPNNSLAYLFEAFDAVF